MKNILDLRFIIGLFFLLVGLFLFIGSFIMNPAAGKTETTNLWSGVVYIVFGVIMLIFWLSGKNKAVDSEEGE